MGNREICSDNDCTCFCYCDDEQYKLKGLIFPSGLGNKRAETPEERAHARATALASEWFSDKPCLKEDCCIKCEHDTSCQLDNNKYLYLIGIDMVFWKFC